MRSANAAFAACLSRHTCACINLRTSVIRRYHSVRLFQMRSIIKNAVDREFALIPDLYFDARKYLAKYERCVISILTNKNKLASCKPGFCCIFINTRNLFRRKLVILFKTGINISVISYSEMPSARI